MPRSRRPLNHPWLRCRSEMYGLLLEQYIRDPVERDMLFHAVDTIPCVRECGP